MFGVTLQGFKRKRLVDVEDSLRADFAYMYKEDTPIFPYDMQFDARNL